MYSNNPTVKKSEDHKDKEGLLAKKIIEPNILDKIFQADKLSKCVKLSLNILNTGSELATLSIWITDEKEPSLVDIIEYNVRLPVSALYSRHNIRISPNESVFVRTETSGLVVRLEGFDDRHHK